MKGPKSSDGYAPVRRTYWVFFRNFKKKAMLPFAKKIN